MEFTQEEINKFIINEFGIDNPSSTFAEITQQIVFLTENAMEIDWLFRYPMVYNQ